MGICIRLYVAENERELNVVVSNDDSKRDKSKENPSKVVADFVVPVRACTSRLSTVNMYVVCNHWIILDLFLKLSVIPKSETIATVSDEIDWEDVKIERSINADDENEPVPNADDNFVDIVGISFVQQH